MELYKRIAEFLRGLANTIDPPQTSGELSIRITCDARQAIEQVQKLTTQLSDLKEAQEQRR